MKRTNTIRILSGLMFLIFLCPFFQMCSEDVMFGRERITDDPVIKVQDFQDKKQQYTLSGYELSTVLLKSDFNNLEAENFLDISIYAFPSYIFLPFLSVITFYFSLIKKFKYIIWLCYCMLFTCIFPLVIFYFEDILDDFQQIKYGYYLFIINTITIIVLSKKQIHSKSEYLTTDIYLHKSI